VVSTLAVDSLPTYTRQVLDAEILDAARGAGVRAADAERDADVAKAEYHHAIRRLQLSGGTMREIACALNLSHQRVQQIVDANGGGRRWRRRAPSDAEPLACSFCGREQPKVEKLVAGPGIHICDRCVHQGRRITEGHTPTDELGLVEVVSPNAARCGFCGKESANVEHLVATGAQPRPNPKKSKHASILICNECLNLCDEIFDHGAR
jgi:hypothetical protein